MKHFRREKHGWSNAKGIRATISSFLRKSSFGYANSNLICSVQELGDKAKKFVGKTYFVGDKEAILFESQVVLRAYIHSWLYLSSMLCSYYMSVVNCMVSAYGNVMLKELSSRLAFTQFVVLGMWRDRLFSSVQVEGFSKSSEIFALGERNHSLS